ncbi:MAG TPA: succinate dehydrogenase cytochrome b subunit [Nitrospira sp.]|nr:succinate dehydrogenase cytochrome b subunit [Nitrospira sp.]
MRPWPMIRFFGHILTSLGSKVLIALSGLALAVFVVFHMLGNLQVFQGPEALNSYAAFLREMPMALWSARLALLGIVAVHIGLSVRLAIQNRRARPVGYAIHHYRRASLASRTMALSGSLLALFIVFHLLHLTAGVVDPAMHNLLDVRGHRDVFGNVVHAFQNPLLVMIYLTAQVLLGFHLSHALSSSLQSLGMEHPMLDRLFRGAGPLVAMLVVIGNSAIVLAIAFGLVHA